MVVRRWQRLRACGAIADSRRHRQLLDNLREPRTAINQLLQGRPGLAVADTTRFLINSTLGIGGLFDPAARMDSRAIERTSARPSPCGASKPARI